MAAALLVTSSAAVYCQSFRFAVVGDVQAPSQKAFDMAKAAVYEELSARTDIDAAFFLGDLSMENAEILAGTAELFKSWRFPVYAVPGNHDRDGEKMGPRSLDTWNRVFGSTDTTFVMNGVRFILMNDVRTGSEKEGKDYVGGLSSPQKEWLDDVLGRKFSGKTVLLSHIGLSSCRGRDSLAVSVTRDKVSMLLNAHTHTASRGKWNDIETFDAGAPYAMQWKKEKASDLMNCGTPRGYFIFTVNPDAPKAEWLKIEFHSVVKEYPSPAYACVDADGRLIVNVYGGEKSGRLTAGGREMTWVKMPDPRISRMANDPDCKIKVKEKSSRHVWILIDPDVHSGDELTLDYKDKHLSFTETIHVN